VIVLMEVSVTMLKENAIAQKPLQEKIVKSKSSVQMEQETHAVIMVNVMKVQENANVMIHSMVIYVNIKIIALIQNVSTVHAILKMDIANAKEGMQENIVMKLMNVRKKISHV